VQLDDDVDDEDVDDEEFVCDELDVEEEDVPDDEDEDVWLVLLLLFVLKDVFVWVDCVMLDLDELLTDDFDSDEVDVDDEELTYGPLVVDTELADCVEFDEDDVLELLEDVAVSDVLDAEQYSMELTTIGSGAFTYGEWAATTSCTQADSFPSFVTSWHMNRSVVSSATSISYSVVAAVSIVSTSFAVLRNVAGSASIVFWL